MNQLPKNSEWEEYYFGAARGRIGSKEPIAQGIRKASAEEVGEYREAVIELRNWAKSDAFILVEHSYKKYQSAVEQLTRDFQTKAPTTLDRAKLTLNAEFLSLLCMFRFYIDQTETMIVRQSSPNAEQEHAKFEEITAKEYDDHFAYRFCWKLRNYSQHCGLPIMNIRFKTQTDGGAPIYLARGLLEIEFNRDALLRNFDGWQKVEDDLKQQQEKFLVMPIAEQLIESLRRIQHEALKSRYGRLKDAAETVHQAASHASDAEGSPCLLIFYLAGEKTKPHLQSVSYEFMPLSLVEGVDKI